MEWCPAPEFATCVNNLGEPQDECCYEITLLDGGLQPDAIVGERCSAIWVDEEGEEHYGEPLTWFSPYAVDAEYFPVFGLFYEYKVRSCYRNTGEADSCSAWTTDYVEFMGMDYACFNHGCGYGQEECYVGHVSPLIMPYCSVP